MSARVLPERPLPGHAVCLDLRTAGAYDSDAVVRAALDAPQPAGERRFLVLDEADRLVSHQLLYERLSSYGPAHIVCLAVGVRGERTVRRTLTLRPPAAGVLWVFDTTEEGVPAEAVLRPLVDVLSTPEVFDAVLRALGEVVHGVAVPAVRVLEHDLTDEARARAWRQAVEGLTGPEVPAGTASAEQVPPSLALLLDESLPRSLADHRWLPAQGRAGLRLATCDDSVQDAVDGYHRVRGAAGLLTGAGRTVDLPGDIERVAGELERFRTAVADAFAAAGGSRLTAEHRGVLRDRGIELPEMPREISRAGIVPALRDHTHELIGKGLPLRSVAARLSALSARTAPVGSATRLARLDAICGPERLRRLGGRYPFTAGGSRPVAFAVTGLLALLAGVWPVLGWILGPAVGVLAAGLAHLMLRRRPNRSPDGRIDGGGATGAAPRLFGGVLGGLVGAGLGQFLGLPPWAGAVALAVSLTAVFLLALRDWSRAVDDWWARADPEDAWRILREVQSLVVTTAVHDWLFAEVRHHCSAGAGAVARLLRGLADTADAHGRGPSPTHGPGYAYVPSADSDDPGERGLRRESAGPPGPDGGTSSWSWEDWGDDGADDVWSDMDEEPPSPVRAPAPPAHGSPYASDPFGPSEASGAPGPFGPSGPVDPSGPFRSSVPSDRDPAVARGGAAWGGPGGGPAPAPAWLERRYGDGGPLLVDTLVGDLVAGTLLILDRCWAGIERDPGAVVPAVHEERIAELLDDTRVRLERDVAASPPPRYDGLRDQDALSGLAAFTDRSERPDAARLTGVAPDAVARLVLADDDPARTVALCGPEHMRLLSHDPLAARQVRFVPEAMRRGAAGDDIWRGIAEDVVWTGAGRHAGILRLVPLRADVVHTVRAEEAGEP
ncbi:hypothetical protein [Streptomyces sp. NBC_00233]|uniref:hypothetical protein n=1 Tax=Streptomyces sp. NBC_00233 TaxID=2975686 RepID=UPI00224E2BF3|nr:hypothetical protein [Streptomyces sp. NBC_00233]MCX5229312.1 hypothetical protein [Streptomyces sp. NBC_00233]